MFSATVCASYPCCVLIITVETALPAYSADMTCLETLAEAATMSGTVVLVDEHRVVEAGAGVGELGRRTGHERP